MIPAGGAHPHILRPVLNAERQGTVTLAGVAYVHGIMDGEAIPTVNARPRPSLADKLRLRSFGGDGPDPDHGRREWQDIYIEWYINPETQLFRHVNMSNLSIAAVYSRSKLQTRPTVQNDSFSKEGFEPPPHEAPSPDAPQLVSLLTSPTTFAIFSVSSLNDILPGPLSTSDSHS